MQQLAVLACWVALGFLILLTAVIFLKLLLGKISLSGLLNGDRSDDADYFSLGRTQLLLCTAFVVVDYIRQAAADPSRTSLPDVPSSMLELLGGSQLFYLIGKARALWFVP